MQLKAPCPTCGKRARYTAEEAGLAAVCAACGTRFTLPAQPPPPSANPDDPPVPPAAAPRTPGLLTTLAAGLTIGLVSGLAVVVIVNRSRQQPVAASVSPPPPSQVYLPAAAAGATVSSVATAAAGEPARSTSAPSDTLLTPPRQPAPPTPPANSLASIEPGAQTPTPPPRRAAPAPPSAPAAAAARSGPRPRLEPIAEEQDALTDARIGDAITRGANFIMARIDPAKHELKAGNNDTSGAFIGGLNALEVYALMQCGQAISEPRLNIKNPFLAGLVERMKQFPNLSGPVTYARALRATALALNNRPEDRAALRMDEQWLLKANYKGAYTYDRPGGKILGANIPITWDNSNAQYGLLGVWSAAEAGLEVPIGYWHEVEAHWTQSQMSNGQWPYYQGISPGRQLSMTAAGVASLFVTHDWLSTAKFSGDVGREPFSPALKKGLDWLEDSNHAVNVENAEWWGYTLYGVERVGLASGFKYFGTHDWYREIARKIIDSQNPDGSWGAPNEGSGRELIDTPYALLFLARGRHPILMNKLRFDGFWANRPRDLSNLARYASEKMERPLNWQVVPVSRPWTDWTDSPILYLASHQPPALNDVDYENLKQFILAGGLLYTQADGDSPAFNGFVQQLAARLFPAYPLTDLPPGHPLHNSLFKLDPQPRLKVVSNGARLLIVHSPVDLARSWQLREQTVHKIPYQFGMNLFVYAAGKRDLRNRLESSYIASIDKPADFTIRVARLRYKGNWDPEPYAWTRFARWFRHQTGYAAEVAPVSLSDLTPQSAPIAILTGTDSFAPTQPEIDALRNYVFSGGVLYVDNCGGTGAFEESVRTRLFAAAFPSGFLRSLPADSPLLNSGPDGMDDLAHPRLRSFTIERLGDAPREYPSGFNIGHGHVVFSPLDTTCALLGTETWGIIGYEPEYSLSLMKNLLLWTVDGQKE